MKVEHMFTPFGMLSLIMACLDVIQPKAVSETDEQDLAQLMAKADAENAEVSGDDDDEED